MNRTLSVYKTYENRIVVRVSKWWSFRNAYAPSGRGEGATGVNETGDNQVQRKKEKYKLVKNKMFENNLFVFANDERIVIFIETGYKYKAVTLAYGYGFPSLGRF